MIVLKNLNGITVGELVEALKDIPKDTMICKELLSEAFPVKIIENCTYSEYYVGQETKTYKGVIIR